MIAIGTIGIRYLETALLGLLVLAVVLLFLRRRPPGLVWYSALAMAAMAVHLFLEVPNHLRDASRDKEGFGHGEGYLYPHAYRDHWVAQAYLPAALQGRIFYEPSDQGYEQGISLRVARNRELQLELALPEETAELLSYSRSGDRRIQEWIRRSGEDRLEAAGAIREKAGELLQIARHHRVLIVGRTGTLHLWEAVRSAPEGRVVVLIPDASRAEMAEHYAGKLPEIERPLVLRLESADDLLDSPAAEHEYERILLADALSTPESRRAIPAQTARLAATGARLVIAQRIPRYGQRLSDLLPANVEAAEIAPLREAEATIFSDPGNAAVNWNEDDIGREVERSGWAIASTELVELRERRFIGKEQVDTWLDADRPDGLGAAIVRTGVPDALARVRAIVGRALAGQVVPWNSVSALIAARPAAGE